MCLKEYPTDPMTIAKNHSIDTSVILMPSNGRVSLPAA